MSLYHNVVDMLLLLLLMSCWCAAVGGLQSGAGVKFTLIQAVSAGMLLTQLVPDLLLLLLDDDLLGLLLVSPDHLTLYTLLLRVPIEELPAERVHLETRQSMMGAYIMIMFSPGSFSPPGSFSQISGWSVYSGPSSVSSPAEKPSSPALAGCLKIKIVLYLFFCKILPI